MMCLGHVGLEEHTPRALGNHAAIITEYNAPLMEKLKAFLEAIEYTGFANFDIKYDTRDGIVPCVRNKPAPGPLELLCHGRGATTSPAMWWKTACWAASWAPA